MGQFESTLAVRMLPENSNTRWQLLEELRFQSNIIGGVIVVPIGFVTDFVSFDPLKSIGQRPAVIHDYLYSCYDVSRKVADDVLLEALESVGVSEELAHSMHAAVRLFGTRFKESLYKANIERR